MDIYSDVVWGNIYSAQESLSHARRYGDASTEVEALYLLGHNYGQVDQWEDAIGCFQQVLQYLDGGNDDRLRGSALLALGLAYLQTEQYPSALPILGQAQALARGQDDRALLLQSLTAYAQALESEGDLSQALQTLMEARTLADAPGDTVSECNILNNLGILYGQLERTQEAVTCLHQALRLARSLGDEGYRAHILVNLAHITADLLEGPAKGLPYLEQALAAFVASGDRRNEAKATAEIGAMQLRATPLSPHKGLREIGKALTLALALDERTLVARISHQLGQAYHQIGQQHAAIQIYRRALLLLGERRERPYTIAILSGLGQAYSRLGQLAQAMDYYREALAQVEKNGDLREQARLLAQIATDLTAADDYDGATRHYERALSLQYDLQNDEAVCLLLMQLGTLYQRMESHIRALGCLRAGVRLLDGQRSTGNLSAQLHLRGATLLARALDPLLVHLGRPAVQMLWIASEGEYQERLGRLPTGQGQEEAHPDVPPAVRGPGFMSLCAQGAHQPTLAAWTQGMEMLFEGIRHRNRDEPEQAIACYSRALSLAPALAAAYYHRGEAFFATDNDERALQDLGEALAIDPLFWQAFFSRGEIHAYLEDFERAIHDYSRALALEPAATKGYCRRGLAYVETGQFHQAIADCQRALARNPHDEDALFARGLAQVGLKNYLPAIADLTQAIQREVAEKADAYYHRAMALLWVNQAKKACADFAASARCEPGHIRALLMASWMAIGQGRSLPQQAAILERTPTPAPHLWDAGLCRAIASTLRGDYELARTPLEQLVERVPQRFEPHFWLGVTLCYLGREEQALHSLERALSQGMPPLLLNPLRRVLDDRPQLAAGIHSLTSRWGVAISPPRSRSGRGNATPALGLNDERALARAQAPRFRRLNEADGR